jgi:hypothetical protein
MSVKYLIHKNQITVPSFVFGVCRILFSPSVHPDRSGMRGLSPLRKVLRSFMQKQSYNANELDDTPAGLNFDLDFALNPQTSKQINFRGGRIR